MLSMGFVPWPEPSRHRYFCAWTGILVPRDGTVGFTRWNCQFLGMKLFREIVAAPACPRGTKKPSP